MKNPWKKLSSKIVHKNKWYKVRQDKVIMPDGTMGEYNVVMRPPSVFMIALDNQGRVCLINLYRYTTNRMSLEIPAGNTEGQRPLAAARRELQEETGLVAKKWKLLAKFQIANGVLDGIGWVYLATDLKQTGKHRRREEGIKEIKWISFKKVWGLIRAGKINDSQTITALHYAALELEL